MNSNWRVCTWGDLASLEYGKGLREYENGVKQFPVYGTNGMIGWHTEPLYPHPGVIIGRKGAYRGVHYSKKPFYVIDTAFYLVPREEIDMRWAYYELLTHDINAMDSGSAIPSTSRDAFYELPVRVPPLNEQHLIAESLGYLDDKIDLNRYMNETLEAIANTLFKSWFIDFDPVRAKVEGKQPLAMDEETAALFPSEFENSEQGDIPKGWHIGSIEEIVDVGPNRELRKGSIAPYLDMANVPINSMRAIDWYDREFTSGSKFINGDVLLARITPCLENGKTAYIDFLSESQVGWGSTEFIVLHSKNGVPPLFTYFLARSNEFRSFAIQNMSGTSGRQRVPQSALCCYTSIIPPLSILKEFDRLIEPMMLLMKANDEASKTLSKIRDALLPKLLSGDLEAPKPMVSNLQAESDVSASTE